MKRGAVYAALLVLGGCVGAMIGPVRAPAPMVAADPRDDIFATRLATERMASTLERLEDEVSRLRRCGCNN